jgi:hypothetical protein
MTAKERELFEELKEAILNLESSNNKFARSINERVNKVEESLSKKTEPIHLEAEIVRSAKSAIGKAIQESLTSYNSPLNPLCKNVIAKHSSEISKVVEDSILSTIRGGEFIKYLNDELSHKVARILIDSSKGICDSVINDLKNDNVFRAKLTIVVSDMVKEYRKSKEE